MLVKVFVYCGYGVVDVPALHGGVVEAAVCGADEYEVCGEVEWDVDGAKEFLEGLGNLNGDLDQVFHVVPVGRPWGSDEHALRVGPDDFGQCREVCFS